MLWICLCVTLDVMMVAFNDSFSLVFIGWAPSSRKENGHENYEWWIRTVNYQLSHFLVLTHCIFILLGPTCPMCYICIMMTWHWFLSNCHSIVRAVAWASKSNKVLMKLHAVTNSIAMQIFHRQTRDDYSSVTKVLMKWPPIKLAPHNNNVILSAT